MGHQTRAGVIGFLNDFKKSASRYGIVLIGREKNHDFLARIGLTQQGAKTELMSLAVEDYCKGPAADRDVPGEVWIFGKQVLGYEVYIKIKLRNGAANKGAVCISFHEAAAPLHYPFRK